MTRVDQRYTGVDRNARHFLRYKGEYNLAYDDDLDGVFNTAAIPAALVVTSLTSTTDIAINPAGGDITIGGVSGGAGKLTIAGTSLSIYGGDTTGDDLFLYPNTADVATEYIKLNGAASVDIKSTTKINLDGPVDISGDVTLDTAGTTALTIAAVNFTTGISIAATSLTDGIKISATTPVDGIEVSSACSANALNLSGANATGIYFGNVCTAGNHAIDMIDAFTGMLVETGTYASEVSKGITLSATNTRPVTFVFDDAGSALGAGNYRGVLSRIYIGESQTDQVAIRSIRGQLKVASTKDLNIGTNEMNAVNAVEGYIEMAGTHTIGANTRVAAVHGLVEVNDDITLTSGGYLAGVYAELSQVTAKTVSGIGTVGFLLDKLDSDHTTNQALWTTGMLMPTGSATRGLDINIKSRVGEHDWGVGATGVLLDGTDPDMVFETAGRINATVASGAYATNYNQMAITATQSNDVSAFGSWSELYITGGTIDLSGSSNYAGAWGHAEISGTVTTPGGVGAISGLRGTTISPATFTNNGYFAGCYVDSNITTGLTNNGTTAHYIGRVTGGINPEFGLFLDGCDAILGVASGTAYEDGIKITATVAGETDHDVNADGLLKMYVGSTAYYIPMFTADKVTNE